MPTHVQGTGQTESGVVPHIANGVTGVMSVRLYLFPRSSRRYEKIYHLCRANGRVLKEDKKQRVRWSRYKLGIWGSDVASHKELFRGEATPWGRAGIN